MTEKPPITEQPQIITDKQFSDGNDGGREKQQPHNKTDGLDNLPTGQTDGQDNLPIGLKVLRDAQEVTIKQHIDSVEVVLCCFARPCRYSVYPDDSSEQFLYIQEVSECYARQIMGAARSFALKFSDPGYIDIMKVVRPQTCSRGCCGICCELPIMHVENPPGNRIAYITEKRTCCYPNYRIYDNEDKLLFVLRLQCCYSTIIDLCSDILIDICSDSETVVAQLVKQTKANYAECIGQENSFTITYLSSLSLREKVILLGSMFLIDFHYFERQQRCCC